MVRVRERARGCGRQTEANIRQGGSGGELSTREREVLQLLRDYRAWHTAFGGAMPPDESYVSAADYHSAAFLEPGLYWPREVRAAVAESYDVLEDAITLVKNEGPVGFNAWLAALSPFLGPEADPSLVEHWRQTKPILADWCDLFVRKVAGYLDRAIPRVQLFVVFPSRMTSGQARRIEDRNAELFNVYLSLLGDGHRKTEAVETAAMMCGYSISRTWAVVKSRE